MEYLEVSVSQYLPTFLPHDVIGVGSHSDGNKADLSESSPSSPPNVSWTWTSVHGTELPTPQGATREQFLLDLSMYAFD